MPVLPSLDQCSHGLQVLSAANRWWGAILAHAVLAPMCECSTVICSNGATQLVPFFHILYLYDLKPCRSCKDH